MTIEDAIRLLTFNMQRCTNNAEDKAFELLCKEGRLGALVREMPKGTVLAYEESPVSRVPGWKMANSTSNIAALSYDSPEEALLAAKENQ